MKSINCRVRLSIALIVMLSVGGAVLGNHEVRADGEMCSCQHPITRMFGRIVFVGKYFECLQTDCWLPLE
jgi:hypothetical protein